MPKSLPQRSGLTLQQIIERLERADQVLAGFRAYDPEPGTFAGWAVVSTLERPGLIEGGEATFAHDDVYEALAALRKLASS